MDKKKAGWKAKLFLFAASSAIVAVLAGAGEMYCRYFTRINFLDNSAGLFTQERYGTSYGNTPNFEGISFGATFLTDENGFRIDPSFHAVSDNDESAILILGDSVSFGPALTEEESLGGILRRSVPKRRVYNGSVIGYNTIDYLNAGRAITREKPEIKTVLLFFCLNDVNDASAQIIRSGDATRDGQRLGESVARPINDYLRSRSKLYLFLKNALVDTQMAYFRSDFAYYQQGDEYVRAALKPITELRDGLAAKGIELKVFILPYEAQLRREAGAEVFIPQSLIGSMLSSDKIDHIDVATAFRDSGIDPKLLFLYGDPMHLSADGMKVLAGSVCRVVDGCDANRGSIK